MERLQGERGVMSEQHRRSSTERVFQQAHLGEVVDGLLEGTHDDLIQKGQGLVTQFQVIAELRV